MKDGPDIALVGSLVGDPARANMLASLMTGRALTATELAQEAGVTPQTASTHLARLVDGGLRAAGSSPTSASPSMDWGAAGGRSAGPASTGASGAITSAAASAPRCWRGSSS